MPDDDLTDPDIDRDEEIGIPLGCDVPGGRLYRYRPFDATELQLLIVASQIRFTNATYFNDPWDCRPRVVARKPKDAADLDQIIGDFKQMSVDANPGMPAAAIEERAKLFRLDADAQQRFYDERMRQYIPEFRHRYPVLCLSASASLPLMWSHYASAHRGLCLIFSTSGVTFGAALSVQYSERYPEIAMPNMSGRDMLVNALLTKPGDWRHETEYRVVAREYRSGDDVSDWEPISRNGFVTIEPDEFVGIILGAFMEPAKQVWARGIAGSSSRPVEVWQAEMEHDQYSLRLRREM